MADILKEIIKKLPDGKITEGNFEGANIVLYTKDAEFFLDNKGVIKALVGEFKKRIELRPDPSVTMAQEAAEKRIRSIMPQESGLGDIFFDPQRSRVIVHAEKPGLAIGKQGANLREIRKETLWVPLIRRTPPIRSKIVEGIRAVLYENSEYRRKFLDKVGHRIYDGWLRGKKSEWVRITYLGSARQVGRSCMFLQTPESRVLLDCGIDVAAEGAEQYPYLEAPEFNIAELDAVVVSHSHLDHSGLIPYLFKFGYKGPIYCTAPTRDVMALLQLDMIKIAHAEGQEPLFGAEEVKQVVLHTITVDWEEVTDITPDIRLTFYNSGHILGSSMVHLNIGNGLHNLLYTGDMKYGRTNMLDPAVTQFPRLETVMIESTYGGRENVISVDMGSDEHIREIVTAAVERGGKILMPVLGSGRAQEVMITVEKLAREGKIPNIPVYLDGMLWDITAIHTAYPEYLNRVVRKQIFHKDNNPFLSDIFKRVGSGKERAKIIEEAGPCIIMATSGMLVGGPSVEYLKGLAGDKRHALVFTCYQGEGTLGRRIQGGERELTVKEAGKPIMLRINMEVHRVEMSQHSDRRELMNFIQRCSPRPKKVIINHGESSRCLDLASGLHKMFHVETVAPKNLEAIRVK